MISSMKAVEFKRSKPSILVVRLRHYGLIGWEAPSSI